METQDYFYIHMNDYFICDVGCCDASNRTIDIQFNDLASNEKLLDALKLESMYYKSKDGWFAAYLSCFTKGDNSDKYNKLLKNPMIRILFFKDSLLETVKNILNNSK